MVTSDGVAVGSTVSVQIDPQGQPTAITARVETASGETHVQLPIGVTQPGERDVRLNANDAQWRAFLERNAGPTDTAAAAPAPPPLPLRAASCRGATFGFAGTGNRSRRRATSARRPQRQAPRSPTRRAA